MDTKVCAASDLIPRKTFVSLALSSLFFGAVLLSLGLAAFTFTDDYQTGTFFTGFMLLGSGMYNLTYFFIRIFHDDNKCITRHKRIMEMASSTLSGLCFTACIIAAILDHIAAYLLQQTDFTRCAYTGMSVNVSCSSPICPTLELQARTCFCCYLYDSRTKGGCNTPLLLAKQTYFSGIDSCSDIPRTLQPMLSAMGGLNLAAAIVSVVYVFQSTPVLYPKKNKKAVPDSSRNYKVMYDRILHSIKMTFNRLLLRTAGKRDSDEESNPIGPETAVSGPVAGGSGTASGSESACVPKRLETANAMQVETTCTLLESKEASTTKVPHGTNDSELETTKDLKTNRGCEAIGGLENGSGADVIGGHELENACDNEPELIGVANVH